MDSPQPHHTLLAKTGEGWKGKSQEFFFPAIFPLPYRGNQKNPTPAAMGKPRLGSWGSAPFPPSKIWFGHTVCRRLNPYLISTSSCVQTNIKNRNSVFGKDNQSRAAHPPRKKKQPSFYLPDRITLITLYFQALENYFQAFERTKVTLWEMAKLI